MPTGTRSTLGGLFNPQFPEKSGIKLKIPSAQSATDALVKTEHPHPGKSREIFARPPGRAGFVGVRGAKWPGPPGVPGEGRWLTCFQRDMEVRWAKVREPPSSSSFSAPDDSRIPGFRIEAASLGHLLAIADLVLKASS